MKSLTLFTFLALLLTANAWGKLKKVNWKKPWEKIKKVLPWELKEKSMGQSSHDALCFDLNANGGSGPGNEETKCTIYVRNNGHTSSEKGISKRSWKHWQTDCIDLKNPSRWSYTYVWTTCDDALWIDQMYLGVGYCAENYNSFGCNEYGSDNTKGWCLSTDRNDGQDSRWKKYAPSGCWPMIRLGKPGFKDQRVWTYHKTKDFGRRQLTGRDGSLEELTQKVKDCEAEGHNCERLADKVFSLFDDIPSEDWVSDEQQEDSTEQKLDEHCYSVVADYEKEIHAMRVTLADLEEKAEKEEEIRFLKEKLSLLEGKVESSGRRFRM